MGDRLTKEREAEIRRVVDKMGFHPTPSLVRDLLAELDALRAAPPTTYLHADGTEEPIGELVARLTRERDEALTRVRELEAERDEARAQLARLREAGEAVDEADASGDDTVLGVAIRHLRGVINADGATMSCLAAADSMGAARAARARKEAGRG